MDRITVSKNMEKPGVVYTALNRVNGKRYIGVTAYPLSRRRSEHVRLALQNKGSSTIFYAAIRKYGPDAFEWSLLKSCSTYDEALREEIRLIAEMAPAYNIVGGGQGMLGWQPSEEARRRISEGLRGRVLSAETRAKIAEKVTGFRHTAAARSKISAARIGYVTPAETRRKQSQAAKTSAAAAFARAAVQAAKRRPVRIQPLGLVFESQRLAAQHLGVSAALITRAMKRGRLIRGRYTVEIAA